MVTAKFMRSRLIHNKAGSTAGPAVAAKAIQKFTFNFSGQTSRLETLEDRPHLAIPMVMLVEGVHNGSDGALYYPTEELSKTPQVWNHKPIVVYHPEMNGVGISACDPVVINTRKVGLIMNAKFQAPNRLTAEAWIEKDRADKVDPRIMEAITKNEMMELSTGVFVDVEQMPGIWNQEDYVGVARNYRPDHLALLPDKTGACSIADGAGFIRNQKGKKLNPAEMLRKATEWISQRWGLVGNEMSADNIECALQQALQARFNPGDNGPWLYVADVYSNFVIYEYDNQLYRLGYTTSDTGVTLSEDKPVEVNRVTEYRTVDGAFVGNKDQPANNENTDMDKTKMILAILAAGAASGWSEADRPALEKLTDNQIKTIHNGIVPDPKKPLVDNIIGGNIGWTEADRPALMAMNEAQLARLKPATAPAPAAAPAPAPATTTNAQPAPVIPAAQPKIVSIDDYIGAAPAGVQEVLRNSMDSLNAEKGRLIGVITKNQNNPFTAEQLQTKGIGELRALAQLAGGTLNAQPELSPSYAPAPVYYGQAPVTDNQASNTQEAVPLPSMDFTPAAK